MNLEQKKNLMKDDRVGEAITAADASDEELTSLQHEMGRLRSALEDVVTLAHGPGDAKQRLVQMERRAIASLSGSDQLTRRTAQETRPDDREGKGRR